MENPTSDLTISILGPELTFFDKDKLKKILELKLKQFRAGEISTSEYSLIELVELAGYLERYPEAIEVEKKLIEYARATIQANRSSASLRQLSMEQDFPVEVMELDLIRWKVLSGQVDEAKREYPIAIANLEERKNRKSSFWRSHCNNIRVFPSCYPCEVAIAFAYKGELDFAEKILKQELEVPRGMFILCEKTKLGTPPVKTQFRLTRIGYDDGISECLSYLVYQYVETNQKNKATSLIQHIIDKMNSKTNIAMISGDCKLLISKLQLLASTIDLENSKSWLKESEASKNEGIKLLNLHKKPSKNK